MAFLFWRDLFYNRYFWAVKGRKIISGFVVRIPCRICSEKLFYFKMLLNIGIAG
jgi:hypothetical protein